jgi:hypothetical protein
MSNKLKLQRVINSRLELFEKRIAEGWTQKMLLEDLANEGLLTTYKYFNDCLNKARKAKNEVPQKTKATEIPPAAEKSKSISKPVAPEANKSSTGEFKLESGLSDEDLYGK